MRRLEVLFVATLSVLPLGVRGQSNPLLGSWALNLNKSTFNHDALPDGETRNYKPCDGDGVQTDVVTVYGYWRVGITQFCAHLDGKEYPYISRIADKVAETGTDWRSFHATVTNKGKLVRATHTVVSEDGKTLTRTTRYPDRETDVQVYDKLPY